MAKYKVYAIQAKHYVVTVEARSMKQAVKSLDEWIEDDFEEFKETSDWAFEVEKAN